MDAKRLVQVEENRIVESREIEVLNEKIFYKYIFIKN
jgi:hypothetical protein